MSNHAEIMESRGHYYDFLARLFEKEMTGALLQQVSKLDYSVACGQEEMQSGYALLGQYFAGGVTAGMEDDLAADYAKTFLAAGEAKGNAAFPYESVYTSEERLLMQDAWTQVKGIYASHGLALKGDNVDLKEDHIAIELKYMAYLCRHGSVADQ